MNLALKLFLSCGGKIKKSPTAGKKEKEAAEQAEREAYNQAAKQEVREMRMLWYGLPPTRAANKLLRWFTPKYIQRKKLIWKELYKGNHYPENYYGTQAQTRPETVAQYR